MNPPADAAEGRSVQRHSRLANEPAGGRQQNCDRPQTVLPPGIGSELAQREQGEDDQLARFSLSLLVHLRLWFFWDLTHHSPSRKSVVESSIE
jgi:hypothetical protein